MNTIHIIGDSISLHYGTYLSKYIEKNFVYSRKEGRVRNFDQPEGANAGDSSMIIEYLHKCKTKKLFWDLIAINCGLHDIKIYNEKYQISLAQYERNLKKIFEILRELSCNIIWIQTTPVIDKIHNSIKKEFNRFNKDVIAYNKVSKKITLSNGALLLDLYEFTKALGGTEIYKDHVHFICEIRKLQAAYIAGHIQTLMNLPLK